MDAIESTVKTYILEQILPGTDPNDLTLDTPLISGGIIDSLATVKLIVFLEEKFNIVVDAHESGNFETINLIAKLVRDKQERAASR